MMNKQKKENIMSLLNKRIIAEGIDLNHLKMMMEERGYEHPSMQEFLGRSGLRLSKAEFTEIYNEIKTTIDNSIKEAEEKKASEEAAKTPSFKELIEKQGQNVVTNDKDLLSNMNKGNEFVTEDYSKSSQGSYFTTGPIEDEPAAEEVQLPSKGRFYTGIISEKEGKILIRPMTLKEETIFTTKRLLKNGQAIDMVLRNCIKTPGINTSEILSSDRVFLLFFLRAISYGTKYTIKTKCPNCGTENQDQLDIMELEIKDPPEVLTDPFPITLPMSGLKMEMRLSRGKDEAELLKSSSLSNVESNEVITERIISLIVSMEGINPDKYKSKLTNLIGGDISHIRQTLEAIDFGYRVDKENYCKNSTCNSSYQLALTINENFFRSE